MALIDSHCHLDALEFSLDRDAVVARASTLGVRHIIVPAVHAQNFAQVQATCRRYALCRAAYGLHPMFVAQHQPQDLQVLRQILQTEPAVAVGEIGLDGWDKGLDWALQLTWFEAQLNLADELALPVLLHVRHAVDAVILQLRRTGVRRGIAHAFNGSLQQAGQLIDMGFKLGFGGAVTWPNAIRLRALAVHVPLSCIVLETDAPDMSPAWARGQRNQPEYIARIAHELAMLRGIHVEEVSAVTTANVQQVLGVLDE